MAWLAACGESSKSPVSAGDGGRGGSSRAGSSHSAAHIGGNESSSGGADVHATGGGETHAEAGDAGAGTEHGSGGAHNEPDSSHAGTTHGGSNHTGTSDGGASDAGASHAGGEPHSGHPDTGGSSGADVTFYEDVAPILNENCVSCHQPGSIAPFSLVDYVSAKPYAHAMAHAVMERHMPPMPVDNSGVCNTFKNARWLSDAEISTIVDWAEEGAAEGDPASAPEAPEPAPDLDNADVTLDTGVDYLPTSLLNDDYRCFVLSSPITTRSFVTAYQVFPGEPSVVHHVILYQPSSQQAVALAQDLDRAQSGPGYSCFGGPSVTADPIALWAPGGAVVEMPAGTGIALEPGRDLILQVHYNIAAGSLADRSRVQLKLASNVTPARFMPVANTQLQLLPNDVAFTETEAAQNRVVNNPLVVYGAAPHMHERGKTLEVNFKSEGIDRCMVSVDRWHFHWQNLWWYQTPITLSSLQQVRIRCGYDTRGLTQPVFWGESTQDEMCLSYFYITGLD